MKATFALAAFAVLTCAGAAQAFILEAGCPPNATCATVDGEIIGSGGSAVVYIAINNAGPEGVELGGKMVGNGSHLLDSTGDYLMDCTANEAECRAALEEAKDAVSDGGNTGGGNTGGGEAPAEPAKPDAPSTPPADDGRTSGAEAQVYTDGAVIYFIGGARLYYREGKLIFQPGR